MSPSRKAVAAKARPSATRERAILRRLLFWAQQADSDTRADAASALARAYLYSDLTPPLRDEFARATMAFIADPCVDVRRALAEAFSSARRAPRRLVVALANDQPEVAAPILARSPLLTDAELIDCVAAAEAAAQCAIARRPGLGCGPAAALADVGKREAALALIQNSGADLTAWTLRRLFARFGHDAEIRKALLARPNVPASLRAELAMRRRL
jgi:uncharacterized protein (DUF2336 family)